MNAPATCPGCGAENRSLLSYCAVCGMKFTQPAPKASTGKNLDRRSMSKEQKLKIKKLKKKRELTEKFKNKKITSEQYVMGLRKLGYGADVEKAMAFKRYINEQIQAFEKMEVAPEGMEGQYRFDPNESKAQLPRDESGNIITDFSISPTPSTSTQASSTPVTIDGPAPSIDPNKERKPGNGPVFGDSLFPTASSGEPSKQRKKEIPKGKLITDEVQTSTKRSSRRRVSLDLEWDEDDEEEEEIEFELDMGDEEGEEEFVIDLEEEEDFEGESGWWDDEEWELDWSDEDEEEWEDWDLEDDEWEAVWDDDDEEEEDGGDLELEMEGEDEEHYIEDVDWEEDEEDEEEEEFEEYHEEDDDPVEELEDEGEDDDWDEPSRRGRRRSRF